MSICRDCSPNTEPVRARLLLPDAPLRPFPALRICQVLEQFGPSNSRLYGDQALPGIEVQHAIHGTGVYQGGIDPELLAPHGVAPTGDADSESFLA